MVWSCISWYGVGYIVDVGKNMDKNVYLSVLQDDLVKPMTGYCEENDLIMADFEFMQDNDPKYKSKIVSEWLSMLCSGKVKEITKINQKNTF
ncbi:hypothetical protein G6F49_013834 [Rhizopus delemar]|uniref:Uncharacterized protein n=2 Tax=Rhizopus TaxID=4842 RepID=A0A9P7BZT5_9FUNG|nr:hypothetical protein G6F53_013750 [Rhizopus delemar]KAG1529424.1 hypothetical protein G6F50_018009 [Rhizopus delemar]KAG1530192.1 hypothetical protein G6F51_013917 [Rhizopus arrhizus]KAG1531050.1 hypothetical protein G6F49_013834 [Rhizopus delemar]KAG1564632.1 hypothetical protein G6F48_013823 [Rhizopus delemar]